MCVSVWCVCVSCDIVKKPAVDSFMSAKCLQLTGGVSVFDNTSSNAFLMVGVCSLKAVLAVAANL